MHCVAFIYGKRSANTADYENTRFVEQTYERPFAASACAHALF